VRTTGLLAFTLSLVACYSPKLGNPGFFCHADDHPACPNGQSCVSGRCVNGGQQVATDLGQEDGPPPGQDGGAPHDFATTNHDLSKPPVDLAMRDAVGGCGIKINEIQTAGTTATDEFIELYNSCATATTLTGKLVYRSATGTSDVTLMTFSGQSVGAGQWFVCGGSGFTGTSNATYSGGSMAGAGGGVAVLDSGGATVDSVGYGTATNAFVQGSAAPAPAASQSIERLPDGHDTGNNGSDFTVGASPTPGAANQ
jgi:hypothetical protein